MDESRLPLHFAPSPRYWLLAGAGIGAGLLFGWEMRAGLNAELLIVAVLGLAAGLWALRQATTQVAVETASAGAAVAVRRFGSSERVEFSQICDVAETGRWARIVSILYYPRLPGGQLDQDAVRTLALPALRDQAVLLAALQAGAPRPVQRP